jgi:hypothetical protein
MSFGYLIIVSSHKEYDYHSMAYLLALSIKRTQKTGYDNVALVTDSKEKYEIFKSSWAFDQVELWDKKDHWDGRSYMNKLSPWQHTVCLDADMIFLRDTSHWIDHFVENCDLYITPKAYTYRNEIVTSDYYRKSYIENNLPTLYSAYTFFKKESPKVHTFFNLVQHITEQKTEFKNLYFEKAKPVDMGTDEIFSLASNILDITDEISYNLEFPKFVHMKPMVQNFNQPIAKWDLDLGIYMGDCDSLKIGSFQQLDILHYVEKDINLLNYISMYESKMRENFKL